MIHERTVSDDANLVLKKERGFVGNQLGEPKVKKEDALRTWGPPEKARHEGQAEVWEYRRELAWSGPFVVIGFIPIPLVVPVGYRNTHLFFTDDVLTKVVREFGGPTGAICGLSWDWSAGNSGSGWSFHCGEM
jgi:hypothetical protein